MTAETQADDENTQIEATIDVDKVVFAIKMNDTNGADDRVIAVPQRDGAEAYVRRAFRGSERYSDPSSAPVHINPAALVESRLNQIPTRSMVDTTMMDVPELKEDRTDEHEEQIEAAYDAILDNWERDVRHAVKGEHTFEDCKGNDITLRIE